jgi:hypothetical protein
MLKSSNTTAPPNIGGAVLFALNWIKKGILGKATLAFDP